MNQKKKIKRVKPNPNQVQKKIHQDSISKWEFIIPNTEAKEFIRPHETKLNEKLTLLSPIAKVDGHGRYSPEGNLGKLTSYFIPWTKYSSVQEILTKIEVPEKFHDDLIWAYLNMTFAASQTTAESKFKEEARKGFKEWIEAFGLVEDLISDKLTLDAIILEYSPKTSDEYEEPQTTSRQSKINRFKDKNVTDLFLNIIKHYKSAQFYDLDKLGYENVTKYSDPSHRDSSFKNTTKQWQSYYAIVLFDYLTQQSLERKFGYVNNRLNHEVKENQIEPLLSNRKIHLLIGKLMMLAGLLNPKEVTINNNDLDETLIDNIEKKVNAEIKAKQTSKLYKNDLLNQGIRGFEMPPFYFYCIED